jgi:hypothetical protein
LCAAQIRRIIYLPHTPPHSKLEERLTDGGLMPAYRLMIGALTAAALACAGSKPEQRGGRSRE